MIRSRTAEAKGSLLDCSSTVSWNDVIQYAWTSDSDIGARSSEPDTVGCRPSDSEVVWTLGKSQGNDTIGWKDDVIRLEYQCQRRHWPCAHKAVTCARTKIYLRIPSGVLGWYVDVCNTQIGKEHTSMLPNLDLKVNIFNESDRKMFKLFANINITNLINVQKKIKIVIFRIFYVGIRQYAMKLLHIGVRRQNVGTRQHIKKVYVGRRQGETFIVGTQQYAVNKHFGSRWYIIGTRQNNKVNVGLRRFITKPVGARHKNKVNYVGT